jgi:hypothetical protein
MPSPLTAPYRLDAVFKVLHPQGQGSRNNAERGDKTKVSLVVCPSLRSVLQTKTNFEFMVSLRLGAVTMIDARRQDGADSEDL